MLKATLATQVGKKKVLGKYWNGQCGEHGCHYSEELIIEKSQDDIPFKNTDKDRLSEIKEVCKKCGNISGDAEIFDRLFVAPIYDTPSGDLEPGNIFWADYLPDDFYWDNHKGAHLFAILPNGEQWCIDSRASNCGLPDDKLHRCWCRHGEPPEITVDKNGNTCNAGAGSILMGSYHGMLQNGYFT